MSENIFDIKKETSYRDEIEHALIEAQKALAAVCDTSLGVEESLDAIMALTASIQFAHDVLHDVLTFAIDEIAREYH